MIYYAVSFLILALTSLLTTCFVPGGSLAESVALGLAATFAVLTALAAGVALFFGSSS
jgi:hypothetical protein